MADNYQKQFDEIYDRLPLVKTEGMSEGMKQLVDLKIAITDAESGYVSSRMSTITTQQGLVLPDMNKRESVDKLIADAQDKYVQIYDGMKEEGQAQILAYLNNVTAPVAASTAVEIQKDTPIMAPATTFSPEQIDDIYKRLPAVAPPGASPDLVALINIKAKDTAAKIQEDLAVHQEYIDALGAMNAHDAQDAAQAEYKSAAQAMAADGRLAAVQTYLLGNIAPTDAATTVEFNKSSGAIQTQDPNVLYNTIYKAIPAAADVPAGILAQTDTDYVRMVLLKQDIVNAQARVKGITDMAGYAGQPLDRTALADASAAELAATQKFREAYEHLREASKIGDLQNSIQQKMPTFFDGVLRTGRKTIEAGNNVLESTGSGILALPGFVLDLGNQASKYTLGFLTDKAYYEGSAGVNSYNYVMGKLKEEREAPGGWGQGVFLSEQEKSANDRRDVDNITTGLNIGLIVATLPSVVKSVPGLIAQVESKGAAIGAKLVPSAVESTAVVAGDAVKAAPVVEEVAATVLPKVAKTEVIAADVIAAETKVVAPVVKEVEALAAEVVQPVVTAEKVVASNADTFANVTSDLATAETKVVQAETVVADTAKVIKPAAIKPAEFVGPDLAAAEAKAVQPAAVETVQAVNADVAVTEQMAKMLEESEKRITEAFRTAMEQAKKVAPAADETAVVTEKAAAEIAAAETATQPGLSFMEMNRLLRNGDMGLAAKLELMAQKGGTVEQMEKVLSRYPKFSGEDFTAIMNSKKLTEVAPQIQQKVLQSQSAFGMEGFIAAQKQSFANTLNYLQHNKLLTAWNLTSGAVTGTVKTGWWAVTHPKTTGGLILGGIEADDMLNDGLIVNKIEEAAPVTALPLEGGRKINGLFDKAINFGLNVAGYDTSEKPVTAEPKKDPAAVTPADPAVQQVVDPATGQLVDPATIDPNKPKKKPTTDFNSVVDSVLPKQAADVVKGITNAGSNMWNTDGNKTWMLGLGGLIGTSLFMSDGPIKSMINFMCILAIGFAVMDKFGLIPQGFKDSVGDMFKPPENNDQQKRPDQQFRNGQLVPGT